MALFKSDQNIVDTLKQELAPLGAEMKEGINEIQSSIKALCDRVEALEKENVKLHASVALKKNQLEEEAETKASQKAAEIVAGMGHKAVVDKPEDGEETPSILEQYTALSGEEQRKFYEAHQGEIAKLCEK